MILAIQDANILIDLHHTGLLKYYFALENETYTTDLVLQEVRHDLEIHIQRGELKIKSFTATELQDLLAFKATQPGSLSLEDCSVLQLAIAKRGILLTGESTLRKCAKQADIEAHGIIWLFDLLLVEGVIDFKTAASAMRKLLKTNPRLPVDECEKRLRKWTGQAAA